MQQHISLTAADGYQLAATVSTPERPALASDGRAAWIVIGSATAVPRGFYAKFAQYAASCGLHVIATDYRGCGGSKPASLRGFDMQYADWSRLDLAAAIDYAQARGPVWLVGHSLAGHALGQLPDPGKLQAAIVCAAGAGWHGHMPALEAAKAWAMWHLLGPVTTRIWGYHPMSKFGMGEDLPMGVYRDWKRWCQFPSYSFDDPAAAHITQGFDRVTLPLATVNTTDDWWALPSSRNAFFKHFKSTRFEPMDFAPAQLGVQAVGHMGYFRANVGRVLWPRMLTWLEGHGLPTLPIQTVQPH